MPAADWVPFLWPDTWRDAAKLDLIRGTPFNCAVGHDIAPAVREALHKNGIDAVSLKDAPITLIKDARWPQVQTGSNGDADAGPTGNPWVDANGFAIQAARALAPGKPVWLAEAPPSKRALRPDDYRLAVCDAAAYGGHWLPSPDLDAWPHIVAAQKLFCAHVEWQQYRPVGRLAVVADFAGPRRDFAIETLNLLTRLYVPFQIVPKAGTGGFPVILNLDEQNPAADPWELAFQTHEKLGRRNDLFRLWNGGSLNAYYTVAAEGGSGLLQLINYAAHVPGQAVTAGVMTLYRSARIYALEQTDGAPIELHRVRDGVEIYLPPFSVYAAIELRR
jgi:hypothetical protein